MLSGDKDNHHATGTHTTGSHGAHSTSHNTDYNTGIEHHNNPSSGYGSSTSGAFPGSTGTHSNTAGPHSSNLANKMDPRVDSDMDSMFSSCTSLILLLTCSRSKQSYQSSRWLRWSGELRSEWLKPNLDFGLWIWARYSHGHPQHSRYAQPAWSTSRPDWICSCT